MGAVPCRFLSVVSPLITAYGFTNITFDSESLSMRHQNGSLYLFIPQVNSHSFSFMFAPIQCLPLLSFISMAIL